MNCCDCGRRDAGHGVTARAMSAPYAADGIGRFTTRLQRTGTRAVRTDAAAPVALRRSRSRGDTGLDTVPPGVYVSNPTENPSSYRKGATA